MGTFFSYLAFIEIFFRKIQNSRFAFFIALLFLFFLSGLRYEVGMDWYAYLGFYNDTATSSVLEVGYSTINNFFSLLDLPYNVFLFAISLLTLFFIYKVGISLKYKLLFIFVYFSDLFLYLNLSGMRQGIAIAITLFSIKYIVNRKIGLFLLTIGFSSLFHFTSLVFLIAYPAYWYTSSFKKNIVVFSFLIFVYFSMDTIVESLLELFVNSEKIVHYFATAAIENGKNINEYLVGIAKRSIVLIFYFTIPKKLRSQSQISKLINVYLIGYLIFLFFYPINGDIGARLGAYFLIFDAVLFSLMFQCKISIYHKLSFFVIILFIYIYKLYGYSNIPEYSYKVFL